jgi:Rod binding domain-containing protein
MSPISAVPGALPSVTASPARSPEQAARERELRAVAVDFEAVFLAQMLQYAGVGKAPEGFSGGAGEEAFGSQLVAAQAKIMAENGGIGIADRLFEALVRQEGLK